MTLSQDAIIRTLTLGAAMSGVRRRHRHEAHPVASALGVAGFHQESTEDMQIGTFEATEAGIARQCMYR
ncbi:MAG: hypothetical protein KAW84_04815 [Thermoplasmata archaeon]|nr:hypothetical protein [Thermoplasmata archaeon]